MPAQQPSVAVIHAITPGDHFSPLTGSAIPTVVDGLARGASANGDDRQRVVVQRGTYRPRYGSADVVECDVAPAVRRWSRYTDPLSGALGLPRSAPAVSFGPTVRALRTQPPSIVLAHNAPLLPWLLRNDEHRVVLYAHNHLLRSFSRSEAGRVLDTVESIVCVSEALADMTRGRLPPRIAERVRVVANAVDTEHFAPRRPDGPPTGHAPMRIMFVGRVIPEKGADVLIRAAAHFDPTEVEIVIVGSEGFDSEARLSRYERDLRELAGRGRVPVAFQPFVDRRALPELLRSADVLVVPSRWAEPSGLTVGEGLATGLPVVASRVGGIPEVLGSAGLLVAPNDVDDLHSALRRLMDDVGLRSRLGQAARARARSYDWPEAWRRLRSILRRET